MSRLLPLAVLAAALSISTLSQAAEAPGKTIIIPDKSERAYTQYHYAPAIKVGDTVIVSGIPAGGPGTYTEQVRRMFLRAKATLEAAGATMEDVIELQSFHVNAKTTADFQKEFAEFLDVQKSFSRRATRHGPRLAMRCCWRRVPWWR